MSRRIPFFFTNMPLMENQNKYNSLRQQYPEFCFNSFSYSIEDEGLTMKFNFSAGDIHFEPCAKIPNRKFLNFSKLSAEQYNLLVFQIGMVELVSYWKCVCSPKVIVKPFKLTKSQIAFWKKLYFNGLGEFFYINGISASRDDFMDIVCESNTTLSVCDFELEDKFLVPIGGGKDSVVTLEILRNGSYDLRPLIMNPRGATVQCAEKAGFSKDDFFEINRTIDSNLLKLNAEGCLNGHTPFSAMLAFYTLLASALTGYKNIALSNENSANEATVIGTEVNHQYSKSLEFENDFRNYVAHFVSPNFNYFSFLRPLTELQIAMLFSQYTQYFDVFRSCNAGSKQNIWCGNCPKCLFAYIILSPFIEPKVLENIFGKNLLNDSNLQTYFDELIGKSETKPFECVGTIDEVNTALTLTLSRFYKNTEPPILLKNYKEGNVTTSLSGFFDEHNLSPKLRISLEIAVSKTFYSLDFEELERN